MRRRGGRGLFNQRRYIHAISAPPSMAGAAGGRDAKPLMVGVIMPGSNHRLGISLRRCDFIAAIGAAIAW